jgi:hypothetical protein
MCTSKVKITQSKFMTNAEVTEFLNYSDLDAYEIENRNECEERTQGITPQEEKNYSSVQQETALEPQLQIGQKKRKRQTSMDRGLGWKQDIYPINKLTFSGQSGLNPDLEITEDVSLVGFFFSPCFLTVGYVEKFSQKPVDMLNEN